MTYDDLRAKAEAATKGTWTEWKAGSGQHFVKAEYLDEDGRRCTTWPALCDAGGQNNEANAAYIVAAQPSVIRSLLDRIEKLENALEPFADLLERIPMAADHVEIAAINGDLCEKYVDECLSLTIGDFRLARTTLGEKP